MENIEKAFDKNLELQLIYIFRNEHDQSLVCPDVCKLSVDILKQKYLTKLKGVKL